MKKTLLKMFLVAVALFAGTSVWADDVYNEVYKRAAVTDWIDDADKTDWSASSAVSVDATYGLGADANLTATYITKDFSITDGYKVKYAVDWTFACATGRTGNWNWIQFGSFLRIAINSTYNMQVSTDAGSTWNATALDKYSNNTFTKHIEVVFDTQLKTIESFTWDGVDKTDLVAGTYASATFNTVSTGFVRGGSVNWTLRNYLTTITVSQAEKAAAAEATYTVNYTLGGSTIKTESGTSVEGAEITASSAITVDDVRYLCTADAAPSLTLVAGENELNVPVRLPYSATLKVTTTVAGEESLEETPLSETDDKVCAWVYSYPMYVEKDGVYYKADVTGTYGESGTFTDGQVLEKSVSYTNVDNSVIYFGEPNEYSVSNMTYSNASLGYITGGVAYSNDKVIRLGTLAAGVYQIETLVTGDANRNVVVGDCTDTSVFPTALVTITGTGLYTETFTLAAETPISISGKDQGNGKFNQSSTLDYILVRKVTEATATIGTTGYATFSSTLALDFTEVSNLTAWIATANDGSTVTLSPVTGTVAANTGLVLQGETATIPVATAGTDYSAQNLLVAVSADQEVDAGYVLSQQGDVVVFAPIAEAKPTVKAGQAYLKATDSAVNALRLVFGETTAIRELNNSSLVKGECYDLVGRKVNLQSQKGIYIVNGKKVVRK